MITNIKKIRVIVIFFSITFFYLFPILAMAEDFTFRVPVDIQNLDNRIKKGMVRVEVFKSNNFSQANIIGMQTSIFEITNEQYIGIVTVKFNARSDKNRGAATHWKVQLSLQDPTVASGAQFRPCGYLIENGTIEILPPFQYELSGTLK